MKPAEVFLKIAKDEAETLVTYQAMIDETEFDDEEISVVHEIMSDEFNHCLMSLLCASKHLGIKIGEDHIEPDPNTLEVTEEGGE